MKESQRIDHIANGQASLDRGDFMSARRDFALAKRGDPDDWRAWFGLARALTEDFTTLGNGYWQKFTDRATLLADDEGRAYMRDVMARFPFAIEDRLHGGTGQIPTAAPIRKLTDFPRAAVPKDGQWSEKEDRIFGVLMVIITAVVITVILILVIRGNRP